MVRRIEADNWDSHWDRYAAVTSLNPGERMRQDLILTALRSTCWPAERLLDVGSGQGDFLVRVAQSGAARFYVGFELSETGVKLSKRKLPEAEFLQVDLFSPPAASARFFGWATAAVCSEVIEHVDDPVAFLRTLHRYLADSALLVLTVPGGPMSAFDRHIGHRRHYSASLVRETLTQAGFDIEKVWLAGFPFFNLYRLLMVLRGRQLITDAEAGEGRGTIARLRHFAMPAFRLMFKLNLRNFPLGWQIVVIARKGNP
jgi:SAM-dependent methyltransferase